VLSDPVSPPTPDYPSCIFKQKVSDLFLIDVVPPTGITAITIYGLRKPKKPVWTYDIDPTGRKVFNTNGAFPQGGTFQDIEWSELLFNDIRNRVLKVMGINLRERDMVEYAQLMNADTE